MCKRNLAFAFLGGVIAVGLILFRLTSTTDPARLREEARQNAIEGRWTDVEKRLRQIEEPSADDYHLLAIASQSRGADEEALEFLAKIPRSSPPGAQAAVLQGQIALQRGRARQAESAWLEALDLDPSLTSARKGLVRIYSLQLRREEQLRQLAILATGSAPRLDLILNWCISRGEIVKPSEAVPYLEEFVAADPDDWQSKISLADALRRQAQLESAKELLASVPENPPPARAIRARLSLDCGDLDETSRLLDEGPVDDATLALLRARLALLKKDAMAAVKHARLADTARPDDLETLFVLSQALRLAGRTVEADEVGVRLQAHQELRSCLKMVAEGVQDNVDMYRRIAEGCSAVGLRAEAIAWYSLIIEANPFDSSAQKALFRLRESQDKTP